MTTMTKTDLTKSGTSGLTKGCVVKTGSGYRAEQGSDYFPAVSAETIGSQMIWFGKAATIPSGGRTKAHVHRVPRKIGVSTAERGQCRVMDRR